MIINCVISAAVIVFVILIMFCRNDDGYLKTMALKLYVMSKSEMSNRLAGNESVIGTWRSGKINSELGEGQATAIFNADETFVGRLKLFAHDGEISTSGTFCLHSNRVHVKVKQVMFGSTVIPHSAYGKRSITFELRANELREVSETGEDYYYYKNNSLSHTDP